MLHVYNSLTRKKELFEPLKTGKVGMYVCGITVYDACHMGHGRTYVSFDVIARYLRFLGYQVHYVRNVTDIDDKIIKRAAENNESIESLTTRNIAAMHKAFDELGILPVDEEPKATESVVDMLALIQSLMDKGIAYQGANGDVYFSVKKFEGYGKLSHQNLELLRVGERVEIDDSKNDGLDFVLWKAAKPDEPSWPSPWGPGRPGWHIECSAMSKRCLGEYFDIHGGGSDLRFPHHENELAQSEAANGKPYVKYWMHGGMVQVDKEKMSKSLGNFFTVKDVLDKYPAETLRYFLISSHYRSQLNYCDQNIEQAGQAIERFYGALRHVCIDGETELVSEFVNAFKEAMDDDFNTPKALSVLFDLAKMINSGKQEGADVSGLAFTLKSLGNVLGILQQCPEAYFQSQCEDIDADKVEQLILDRNQARADKNWSRADEIRDELDSMGIVLEDCREGTQWKKR